LSSFAAAKPLASPLAGLGSLRYFDRELLRVIFRTEQKMAPVIQGS
jgi:acetoacetate decarboxylase